MANDAHGKDGVLIITKCLTLDALSIGLYFQEAKVPVYICSFLYVVVCVWGPGVLCAEFFPE